MSAAPKPPSVAGVIFTGLGYALVAISALAQVAIADGFFDCAHGKCGSEGSTFIGAILLGVFAVAPGAIVALGFFARALYRHRRLEAAINAVVALAPLALIAWYHILATPTQHPASLAPMPAVPVAPASSGPRAVPSPAPAR